MTSIGSGYDFFTSQFSPDGRIFQIEYSEKAVERSGTVIGLRGKDGVVFAVEKLVTSKLWEPGAYKRIFTVGKHVGIAVAGMITDARRIVKVAKSEVTHYKSTYNVDIPLHHLKFRVAMHVQAYTLFSGLRPFGCSVMMGSHDHCGPQLFCIEPSGTSWGYFGCAIGKAKQAAKTEIENLGDIKNMTCVQLIKEAARIICLVHDEIKDKDFELELSWVGDISKRQHVLVPQEIFDEAEAYGRRAMQDNDSDVDSD
nr:proteasome subunit alpha type-3-like [Parasteatoda tepidariorum]